MVFHMMTKWLAISAFLVASSIPAAGMAQELEKHIPALSGTEYFQHDSDITGTTYHIFVKTPADIPADGKKMPVIYMLDGDTTFPLIAAYSQYMLFPGEMPPAIIVGIAYGTRDPAVNMRNRDFTTPAETNPQYGGADRFLSALENEIMPRVEAMAPADPQQRIIVGQSLGGQFVLHTAFQRPGLFDLSIAVNPALHRNLSTYLQALDNAAETQQQSSLYVSSAQYDAKVFRGPALEWIGAASQKDALPWYFKAEILDNETHLSSLPRAFRNAMIWYHVENSGREAAE